MSHSLSLQDESEYRDEATGVLAQDFLERYRSGEYPSIESYATRHPDLAEDIRRVFPMVAAVERIKIGHQSTPSGAATLAGRSMDQLGDFQIVREIGRGGMGVVFEAIQESLGRRVALKVLPRQSLLEPKELERFHREAQTAAAMHHTNIVPIFGTGEHEGAHYLVMQLVEGESLDKLIGSSEPFSFTEVARISSCLADAIDYAHDSGVLHQDIKPGNILIEKDGTPQVTDFGLATTLVENPQTSGTLSGSLAYMAPERFEGTSLPQSDVYSIGLTMYEMLAGKSAYQLSSFGKTPPPLPSLQQDRPDVPIDLETIVLKSVDPDPDLRYHTAGELRDDLRRFLNNEPIHARKTPWLQRLTRWCRREPKTAIATVVSVSALLVTTIVLLIAYAWTAQANRQSQAALERSENIVSLTVRTLDQVVDDISLGPNSLQFAMPTESWPLDAQADIGVATASPQSARLLEDLQPLYEGLLQQAPTRPDIVRQMVEASVQQARILHHLGSPEEARETIQEVINMLEQADSPGSLPVQESQLRLAQLYNELGVYFCSDFAFEDADQCHLKALKVLSEKTTETYQTTLEAAKAYVYLGDLPPHRRQVEGQNNQEQLESYLRSAAEKLSQLNVGSENEGYESIVDILRSRIMVAQSRVRPSEDLTEEAIDTLELRLEQHPNDRQLRYELVRVLSHVNLRTRQALRHPRKATGQLRLALSTLRPLRLERPDNPIFAVSEIHIRHKLAAISRRQGFFVDAESQIQQAIKLQSALVDVYPDSLSHRCWRVLLYRSQAEILKAMGKSNSAEFTIKQAKNDLKSLDEFKDHPLYGRANQAILDWKQAID